MKVEKKTHPYVEYLRGKGSFREQKIKYLIYSTNGGTTRAARSFSFFFCGPLPEGFMPLRVWREQHGMELWVLGIIEREIATREGFMSLGTIRNNLE